MLNGKLAHFSHYKAKGIVMTVVAFLICVCSTCAIDTLRVADVFVLQSIPVVPNADIAIEGRNFNLTEFGFSTAVVYYVDRGSSEVTTFYREEMSKRGWDLIRMGRMTINYCLMFQRFGVLKVSIAIYGGGERTKVIIDTREHEDCEILL